ncbi:hypothetical protein M8J76_016065 [Diaphorina citri]|nr:hypothetical protein M8J75_002889 [Diaphorina citri]KAI5741686.1 hypothetical protein M8J76_016065 [Diaphorina citri]
MYRLQIFVLASCVIYVQCKTLNNVHKNEGTIHFDNDEIYSNYPPRKPPQHYAGKVPSASSSMAKPHIDMTMTDLDEEKTETRPANSPPGMSYPPPASSSADSANQNRINSKAPNKVGSIDEILNKPESVDVPSTLLDTQNIMNNSNIQAILRRGITQMTLDMERAIRSVMTKNQNVVFAPLSIVGALALVLLGSDGQTKDELTHFMGVATGRSLTDTIHKSLGAYFAALRPKPGSPVVADVRVANGIFYEDRYMIKKQYAQLAEELYQSEIFRLDFGNPASARFVNNWVSNRTEGRIENLIPGPLSPHISLILANVIYFSGKWAYPFPPEYIKWDLFESYSPLSLQKDMVRVEMMTNMEKVEYSHSRDAQVLGLPYQGNEVYMYFILPKNPDLSEFTKDLDYDKFSRIIESTNKVDVIYTIPKMKVTSSTELRTVLNTMNVTSMFDVSKSDLSNMLDDRGVAVDQVFHKVDIEVTEQGTVAAASTGIIITRISKPTVKINRPFIFFIYHKPTDSIVFWGSIYKPEPQRPYHENERYA